jgi:hypothetical protein
MFKTYTKDERLEFREFFEKDSKKVYDTLAKEFSYIQILQFLFITTMDISNELDDEGYDAFLDRPESGLFISGFSHVDKSVIIHFNPRLNEKESLKSYIDIKIAYVDPNFVSYSTSYELPTLLSENIKIDLEICQRTFYHNIQFLKDQILLLSMGDVPAQ